MAAKHPVGPATAARRRTPGTARMATMNMEHMSDGSTRTTGTVAGTTVIVGIIITASTARAR
jgi:hypothetical protein